MSKKLKKEENTEEDIDKEYEPLLFKQLHYALLICGLLIFAAGLYLTLTNSSSKGISQGRFGGGRETTINGPQTLIISTFFLIPWWIWAIKRAIRKSNKKK